MIIRLIYRTGYLPKVKIVEKVSMYSALEVRIWSNIQYLAHKWKRISWPAQPNKYRHYPKLHEIICITRQHLNYPKMSTLPQNTAITRKYPHYPTIHALPDNTHLTRQYLHYPTINAFPDNTCIIRQYLHYPTIHALSYNTLLYPNSTNVYIS